MECLITEEVQAVKGLGCDRYKEKKTSFVTDFRDQWTACATVGNAVPFKNRGGVECHKGLFAVARMGELRKLCEACPVGKLDKPVRWKMHSRLGIQVNIHGVPIEEVLDGSN